MRYGLYRSPTLLTFAPMIDCELSRLVLAHHRVTYTEEPHIFGWVSVLTLAKGGTPFVPMLVGSDATLTGPRSIALHYDDRRPETMALMPCAQPLRTHVEVDWQRFNGELATDVAVLAYFILLPHRALMTEPFTRGVPAGERRVLEFGYPLLRVAIGGLLRLDSAHAEGAAARIRSAFVDVADRLSSGRSYLHADRRTLADLAFAAAAAPLVQPPGYGAPMPPLERMPAAMQAWIDEMRRHPAAELVRRVYDEIAPQPSPA